MNDLVSSHFPVKCKGATIFSSLVLTGGGSTYCPCMYRLGQWGEEGGEGGRGMFNSERGAGIGATDCNILCCCSAMFWVKILIWFCIAAMLFDSIVIAATALANCLPREDIGEMGEDWTAGVKRTDGSEKAGDVDRSNENDMVGKGNSKSRDSCCQDSWWDTRCDDINRIGRVHD